jgi:hypothetical protein
MGPKCELGPLYKTTAMDLMLCLLRWETHYLFQWRKKIDWDWPPQKKKAPQLYPRDDDSSTGIARDLRKKGSGFKPHWCCQVKEKTHLVGQLCHWAHSATELDLGLPAACQSGVLLLWVLQSTKKKKKREETRFESTLSDSTLIHQAN